jgi:hypothetical protein
MLHPVTQRDCPDVTLRVAGLMNEQRPAGVAGPSGPWPPDRTGRRSWPGAAFATLIIAGEADPLISRTEHRTHGAECGCLALIIRTRRTFRISSARPSSNEPVIARYRGLIRYKRLTGSTSTASRTRSFPAPKTAGPARPRPPVATRDGRVLERDVPAVLSLEA